MSGRPHRSISASQPVVARRLFDFQDVIGGRHGIVITVGPDLQPVILSLGNEPDYRTENRGALFPRRQAARANDFRIHYSVGEQWFNVDVEPTIENFHSIQPLETDHWLLVRGRAADFDDRNAFVTDGGGQFVSRFHAGDGINDVQVTTDSRIWFSYFDEGVFGSTPLSQNGLVCLDTNGQTLFEYGLLPRRPGDICDCYALNVTGKHDTWLYYYTDFPLVQLTDFQIRSSWNSLPVAGSHAFAVTNNRVVFCGNYEDHDSLFAVDLSTMQATTHHPVQADGSRIKIIDAMGRADRLFLLDSDALYEIDCSQ